MEYGGYLEMERFSGKIFYGDGIALNSGRNCLGYLIETNKIKKLYLPYFICDTVINIVNKYGVKLEFYHIDEKFKPLMDFKFHTGEFLYVVNYYGQISEEYIRKLVKQSKNVIIDNAQAFFESPINGTHTLYTCRKFFGVADGGFLFTDIKNNNIYKRDMVSDRMQHILGRYEQGATKFYKSYRHNEEQFDDRPIMKMSAITENILRSVDYKSISYRRSKNWDYVSERLNSYNLLHLKRTVGPFAYPLKIYDGKEIRKKLVEKKIYIPMLWSSVLENQMASELEHDFVANILPIPIDQRYIEKDMKVVCDTIEELL